MSGGLRLAPVLSAANPRPDRSGSRGGGIEAKASAPRTRFDSVLKQTNTRRAQATEASINFGNLGEAADPDNTMQNATREAIHCLNIIARRIRFWSITPNENGINRMNYRAAALFMPKTRPRVQLVRHGRRSDLRGSRPRCSEARRTRRPRQTRSPNSKFRDFRAGVR